MSSKLEKVKLRLSRPQHPAFLIAWLGIGVLLGLAGSALIDIGLSNSVALILGASLFAVALKKNNSLGIILVILAGLIIGNWRGNAYQHSIAGYQEFYGLRVVASGSIAEDPSLSSSGSMQLRISEVNIDGRDLPGEVWVSLSTFPDLKRSDTVVLEGQLNKGFGSLPASMYRVQILEARRPEYADLGRQLRDWFGRALSNVLPATESALGMGFLTGQKSSLPEDLNENMRMLGLTHIVVASGYNLTILVRFARKKLSKISRFSATAGGGFLITGFIMITGLSPSMSRAGLVAGLSLLAWYFGRQIKPFVLLSFAAAITAFIKPSYIWGDLGWYLSFLSFFGVIVAAPLVRMYYFSDKHKPNSIRDILIETTCAQLLTLPILMYTFGEYSPLALMANLLVLPAIPVAMLLTFIAGLSSTILPNILSGVASWPAEVVLSYIVRVTEILSVSSYAKGDLSITVFGMAVGYGIITIAVYAMHRAVHKLPIKNREVLEEIY